MELELLGMWPRQDSLVLLQGHLFVKSVRIDVSEPKQIRDLETFHEALAKAKGANQILRLAKAFRPLLKRLGVDVDKILETKLPLERALEKLTDLRDLPDRFNGALADRGWIAYENLKVEVMREAVLLAERGDVDAAERVLLQHYTAEWVRFELLMLSAVPAFKPRRRLAMLALADYEAERYHACVPVVLLLLDGLVQGVTKQAGFFPEKAELEATNSIAAHSTGLPRLRALLSKSRKKINEATIEIPYRHGILHGIDLGYDNQLVAAKAWVALFAAGEWAKVTQLRDHLEPESAPKTRWTDVGAQLIENRRERAYLDGWGPRRLKIGSGLPAHGSVDEFAEKSPERALVEFLEHWTNRRYGKMAPFVPLKWEHAVRYRAGAIREEYETRLLQSWRLVAVSDEAACITEVTAKCSYHPGSAVGDETLVFRMVHCDKRLMPILPTGTDGRWIVYTWGHAE